MRTFFGIPAHPLLVHVPAVLLPLAAIGVVFMVVRADWHHRYRWAVLAVGFVGTIGAILAADAGEGLQDRLIAKGGFAAAERWDDHAEAGDTAQTFAIVFFVLLAAYILVPWFIELRAKRQQASPMVLPRWVTVGLAVLVLAGSVGTVVTVVLAGHSGAKAVWCDTADPPNCNTGG